MKLNRAHIFIAASAVALLTVLVIQLNWIRQAAAYKEAYFNERASIILARTTEVLSADTQLREQLNRGPGAGVQGHIDSVLRYFMDYYNFHTAYTFEVVRPVRGAFMNDQAAPAEACYDKSLDQLVQSNQWKLQLHFPQRQNFIMKEMGMPFLTVAVLVLVVLLLFWQTVRSLLKEKQLAEHTTDFLNNMTHEFKTPLTSIALAGKMIIEASTHPQANETRQYAAIILEENERLRLQAEQVLSMAALEKGEIPIYKTELDVHRLVEEVMRSMRMQLERAGAHVKTDLQADEAVVTGDRTHLANALRNLVDNAIKYAGAAPQITVRTYDAGQHVAIVISDRGTGIDKAYQQQVFEKFFRVPQGDVHDVKGFGLGLAYVKKIIALHGGTIALSSEKGKGTTFTITLPYDAYKTPHIAG